MSNATAQLLARDNRMREALIVTALGALASLAMLPVWIDLFHLWTTDPLRSIGEFFPFLSLLSILAAWRRLDWRMAGTWWGLPAVICAIVGAILFCHLGVPASGRFVHPVDIFPLGFALFTYGVGWVLLFGGKPLLRVAILPLGLLLCVNPVPHLFNTLVDLPLQLLSANAARGFAHIIGLSPTGDQLRMMFTPKFGMMIVPGCNGLRGASTLAYLALIYGYVRRLSIHALLLAGGCALVIGYIINIGRLCLLVLYYREGVAYPPIQPYGVQVDYVIGGALFVMGTLIIGLIAGALAGHVGTSPNRPPVTSHVSGGRLTLLRALVLASIGIALFLPQRSMLASLFRTRLDAEQALHMLPIQVGLYHLTATSEEQNDSGQLMFILGNYLRQDSTEHLTLGIYLGTDEHFVFKSKLLQGIGVEFGSSLHSTTGGGQQSDFLTTSYVNAGIRTMDAETLCTSSGCGAESAEKQRRLIHFKPRWNDIFLTSNNGGIPIFLRREWAEQSTRTDSPRREFETSVSDFMQAFNLDAVSQVSR